uniref:Uncharacterized protein n=1 Tax=Arundo donax TaxID=35708 RepID=A0A0A8YQI3_ARUDO
MVATPTRFLAAGEGS